MDNSAQNINGTDKLLPSGPTCSVNNIDSFHLILIKQKLFLSPYLMIIKAGLQRIF